MNAQILVAIVLALAVLLGSTRMLWRRRGQDAAMRPRAWRTAALLLAQLAGATLLYFVLFPPPVAHEPGTLVVLTARASEVPMQESRGARVVALPEAGDDAGANAERVPDLATALRRYPATQRIHVLGAGLVARDRDAARGHTVDFDAAPLPRGLTELHSPTRVPAGRRFAVTGRGLKLQGGSAELLDPAGRRVDSAPLDDDGRFELHATTRNAGLASYRLRLRDADAQVVDDVAVPLQVTATRSLRVLVLAGAPNAELKFLRRWALDAGAQLDTRISLGAGLRIGTPPLGFDAAVLDGLDLLLLDDRSWRALDSSQRAALTAAIDRGLGLLLRLTGTLNDADRERLQAFGFTASTEGPARETRLGGGFVRAGDVADALPTLTRSALRIASTDGVALLADAAGTPLTVWRAHGRGRIGVSTLNDSYRLVLAGHGDVHGEVWSDAFTTLARPVAEGFGVTIDAAAPHHRSVICGIGEGASVAMPDGSSVALHIDPASGTDRCAGFWAETAGRHRLDHDDRTMLFHVRNAGNAPGLVAYALHRSTQAMVAGSSTMGSKEHASEHAIQAAVQQPIQQPDQSGPRWPWFLAWLLLSTLAWWFERTRLGLSRPQKPTLERHVE